MSRLWTVPYYLFFPLPLHFILLLIIVIVRYVIVLYQLYVHWFLLIVRYSIVLCYFFYLYCNERMIILWNAHNRSNKLLSLSLLLVLFSWSSVPLKTTTRLWTALKVLKQWWCSCERFNPLRPNSDQKKNFLLTISIHCQEIRLWELIIWSPKRKDFDLLSNSLNSFIKEMYRDQFGEFVCGYSGLKGLQ